MNTTIQAYIQQFHLQNIMSEKLLATIELCHFKKGEYLMHAGSKLSKILFIVSGKAKTLYITHNGVNTLHSFLVPFSLIGDVEFFQHHQVINDVVALCDMDCLSISLRHETEMLQDAIFIYTLASQISTKLIRSNHNKSISLTYPVESRLAAYICASSLQHTFKENQQDAAEMIGCSYRQLQRTLQKFVTMGYLAKQQKGIYILLKEQELRLLGNDIYVF